MPENLPAGVTPFEDMDEFPDFQAGDQIAIRRGADTGRAALGNVSAAAAALVAPGQAGTGMPTFSGSVAYFSPELRGDATNYNDPLPQPCLVATVMPSRAFLLPPESDPITLEINTRRGPLLDVQGQPVAARQITPGSIHLILYGATGFRLLDPLPVRPSEWIVLAAYSVDEALSAAEIAAAAQSAVGARTVAPDQNPADGGFLFFGVPDSTPDFTHIGFSATGNQLGAFVRVAGTMVGLNGVAYKWWRSNVALAARVFDGSFTFWIGQGDTVYV